jgi:UDP-GlcNAc:undecaprenyl-phosphate/decaprenyl-phosphate GlcNAc-1-phosphate transferase
VDLDYLVVFAVALVTVLVTTPVVRWAALRFGAVDEPGHRHIHARPTPTLGGISIFAGVVAAIAVASQLPAFDEVFRTTSEPEAVLLASAVIVALGIADDVRGISAPAKLAGQVLAAGTIVLFGVTLLFVYIPGNPGYLVSLSPDLGALFTIAAIVAMINAVNLIDGLDGLAAGIVAIAATALFVYVQLAEVHTLGLPSSAALLLAAVAGASLAFLLYNFHPASIFMGDTGAMLLGLLLAAAGVSAIGGAMQPTRGTFAAFSIPVLVPVLVLAVPFADTAWAILRRLRSGRAVFSPDKKHLHHRLVEIGHSQRRAVLVMYYWSALVAFVAVGLGLLPLPVVVGVFTGGVALALAVAAVPRLARSLHRPGGGGPGGNFVFSFTRSRRDSEKTPPDLRKRGRRPL